VKHAKQVLILIMCSAGLLLAQSWNSTTGRTTSGGAGVPAGGAVVIISGTCATTLGSGWTEATEANDKFVRGTVAASSDIGGTGGADSVTPTGNVDANTSTVEVESSLAVSVATGNHAHVFTGNSQENRPAFVNVIFCKKD
jgi:hypothetical protein